MERLMGTYGFVSVDDPNHFAGFGSGSASRACRCSLGAESLSISTSVKLNFFKKIIFITWGRIRLRNRIRIWIGIKMESCIRIRIGIKTMPIDITVFLCASLYRYLLWTFLIPISFISRFFLVFHLWGIRRHSALIGLKSNFHALNTKQQPFGR